MPIHANLFTRGPHHLVDYKFDQCHDAAGGSVAAGIANHNGASAAFNGGFIQALNGLGIAARCVFGHVHDLKPQGAGVLHRILRGLEQEVIAPILRITANRAGANKGCRLDGESGFLRNFRDGTNVVLVRARCAVWANFEFLVRDFAGHHLNTRGVCATRAGQTDVRRVDAKRIHQMQQLDLLLDRRLTYGRRLQAVTQRLVVKPDVAIRVLQHRIDFVPIVN